MLDLGTTFDANGNVAGVADYTASGRQSKSMGYDGLDRLTSTTSPMFGTATYAYDTLDNLKQVTVSSGSTPRNHYYCYHATSRRLDFVRSGPVCTGTASPAVTTLGYDVQGNLGNKNGTTYTFDYGNRLRGTAGLTYRYDAQGRRVRQDTAGAQLKYSFYSGDGRLRWQRDEPAAKRLSHIYLGGSLVAELSRPIGAGSAAYTYQHTDALGSPIAKTNSAGTVIETSEYEPYGKLLNRANDDRPGYTGHVMDSASGLTYMQQRYYDPQIGRFLSVDPVTANAGNGSNFNRYWYANNNPYRFTDPDGRKSKEEADHDRERSRARAEAHRQRERVRNSDMVMTTGISQPPATRNSGSKDAITVAGGTSTIMATSSAGMKRLAQGPGLAEMNEVEAQVAKSFGKVGKVAGVAGVAVSAAEVVNGKTTADKGHGALNVAVGVGGFLCSPCAAGALVWGVVDLGVQFKQYRDPNTGETYSGWTAIYKDMQD